MQNMDHKRFDELLVKYLDGSINSADLSELNAILRSSASARKIFLETTQLVVISESVLVPGSDRAGASVSPGAQSSPRFMDLFRLPVWGRVLGAAALVVFLVSQIIQPEPPHSPEIKNEDKVLFAGLPLVGRIDSIDGSFQIVTEDGSFHSLEKAGTPVAAGTIISQSFDSYMSLRLSCGSRLEFMGNGAFGINLKEDDAKQVILYHGFMTADIFERQDLSPVSFHNCLFQIDTTHARFLMRTGFGNGLVQVEDGSVLLTKRSSGEKSPIYTSESVVLTPFEPLHKSIFKRVGRTDFYKLDLNSRAAQVLKIRKDDDGAPILCGVTGKIHWASSLPMEVVNSVVIPVEHLSSKSVALFADSVISLEGPGAKPEWIQMVALCTNGEGQFQTRFNHRLEGKTILPNTGNGTTSSGWQANLKIEDCIQNDIHRKQRNKDAASPNWPMHYKDLLCVVFYTEKSTDDFKISSFSVQRQSTPLKINNL